MPKKPTTPDRVELLLARAEQDPDDTELRGVLIDALVEAGDPRGELGAVQSARAALDALYDALLEKQSKVYPKEVDNEIGVTHASGFVDELTIYLGEDAYKKKRTARAILEDVLAKRAGRMVQSVSLQLSDKKPAKPVKDMLDALAMLQKAPALRSLDISVWSPEGAVAIDVVPALAKLPITKLAVRGSSPLVKSVLAGTWPAITNLTLAPYHDDKLTAAAFKRLFDGKAFPNLVELTPDLPETVIAKLVVSQLARSLKVIDLEDVSLEETTAKKLVAARGNFGKLEKLAINPKYMSTKTLRGFRGFCSEVRGLPDENQIEWVEGEMARIEDSYRYEEIEE